MRNTFIYKKFEKEKLLKALLNISYNTKYISILVSNTDANTSVLPKDYINYDLIAGVGNNSVIKSNNNSFEKIGRFHFNKKDWMFGYLSYDLKSESDELFSFNNDNINSDNLTFFTPEYVLILKSGNLEVKTFYSKGKSDDFVQSFNFSDLEITHPNLNIKKRVTKEEYLKKIECVKEHIQRGDIYELNYCQEFYASEAVINAESVFYTLNKKMKTPFSSFLKLGSQYALSASPERFLRKKGHKIISQPIKGTRRRGVNKLEDNSLIDELKTSQKDLSENIMITDLVRNDLSITAKKSSVKVDELCKVYTFEKVHQMITTVSSEVSEEINFSELLKTVFPMGSMTGAPKLRAMQLIEEFEDFRRGIFSGAIGYITPSSDFDFNVVIRTILYNLENRYLSIGVGGAIIKKSDPKEEYAECLVKARPLLDILEHTTDD